MSTTTIYTIERHSDVRTVGEGALARKAWVEVAETQGAYPREALDEYLNDPVTYVNPGRYRVVEHCAFGALVSEFRVEAQRTFNVTRVPEPKLAEDVVAQIEPMPEAA